LSPPAQPLWLRGILLASYGIFTATQAAAWFPDGARRFHVLAPHPAAALLLLIGLLAAAWHRPFVAESPEQVPLPVRPIRAA
jgi:hypothetical protein